MFLSNAGFNPGFTASTKKASARLRKFSSSLTLKPTVSGRKSPTPPRSPSVSGASFSCELVLLSALQGTSTTHEERQRVVDVIESLEDHEKNNLIDFLLAENGAAACTIVNNACKHFVCSPADLNREALEKHPDEMLIMWSRLYQDIIPNLQSILYPLKRHCSNFDIRKSLLRTFRDKVLAKLLSSEMRRVEWEGMLFTILLETEEKSLNYDNFAILANSKTTVTKTCCQAPLVKGRSKTLPYKGSKSVTWQDDMMRKSATFSN